MIDPERDLPIKQQAEVLGIARSTVYYEPRPISEEDLWLMRRLDELHLNCIEAVEEALSQTERPETYNTGQGSQFPSDDLTGLLRKNGIDISMDDKGRWRDNVFVEQVWKSIKYEEVCLHANETVQEATTSIGKYLEF